LGFGAETLRFLGVEAHREPRARTADTAFNNRFSPRHLSRDAAFRPYQADYPGVRRGSRSVAGRYQNSAGKYPLISRPMQISTRVGVVQTMRLSSGSSFRLYLVPK